MKSGLKSTEFYVTLVSTIVSLLVMAGLVQPTEADQVTELVVQAIGGIVALGSIIAYIYSRTVIKQEEIRANVKG